MLWSVIVRGVIFYWLDRLAPQVYILQLKVQFFFKQAKSLRLKLWDLFCTIKSIFCFFFIYPVQIFKSPLNDFLILLRLLWPELLTNQPCSAQLYSSTAPLDWTGWCSPLLSSSRRNQSVSQSVSQSAVGLQTPEISHISQWVQQSGSYWSFGNTGVLVLLLRYRPF